MCSYLIQSIPFTLGPSASADIGSLPAATSLHSVAVTPTTSSSTPLASGWSIPSISSLMTTPITSILPVASAHLPLILSPALPPIPARLVEKIQKGSFVDMKELLGDNITLFQRMEEVHKPGSSSHQWVTTAPSPKLREVSSLLSWVSCFITYMAVRVQTAPITVVCGAHYARKQTTKPQSVPSSHSNPQQVLAMPRLDPSKEDTNLTPWDLKSAENLTRACAQWMPASTSMYAGSATRTTHSCPVPTGSLSQSLRSLQRS